MRRGKLIGAGVCFTMSAVLLTSCLWYLRRYQPDIRALWYTALLPLGGTGSDVLREWAINALPGTALAALAWGALAAARPRARKPLAVIGFLSLPCALLFGAHAMGLDAFALASLQTTGLYDEEYVDPEDVSITADRPMNLICVYLESMETAYGAYLPGLTKLAGEHVTFTGPDGDSGYQYMTGASWTMGALMTTTSGTPFALSPGELLDVRRGSFAPGVTALGDILAENGYEQEFLCGSEASFGGRAAYFRTHGGAALYDLGEAKRQGVIPEDYHVWWGMEDAKLYEIARSEATRLAGTGRPFCLTVLTADTHFPDGYLCELCGDAFDSKTANVVACADRQASAFAAWCLEQDFMENTVMVLLGDHQRMDTALVGHTPYEERPIYHCFIHPAKTPVRTENRVFTAADLFPTMLSALGFDIEGDRLGLGADLFSGTPTLAERLGIDALNAELAKSSPAYHRIVE